VFLIIKDKALKRGPRMPVLKGKSSHRGENLI
jgi:hypothetical protein